ncbi:MAG: hypothetical protein WCJ03_12910, partial [Bacteroidales bacterium]
MNRRIKLIALRIILIFAISITTIPMYAADDEDSDSTSVHAFEVSLSTANNQIQRGRKLESNYLNITPKFHYCYDESFYADVSLAYFPTFKVPKIDSWGFDVGYNLGLVDSISTGIEYAFNKYASYRQATSSFHHSLTWSLEWENAIATPTLTTSYNFGGTTDFFTDLELTHKFAFKHIFSSQDALTLPLSVSTSFGTSHFYQQYLKQYLIDNPERNKKGKLIAPESISTSFQLTDVILSLAASYEIAGF